MDNEVKVLRILDAFSGSGNWVIPWRNNCFTYKIIIDSIDILKLPHINYCMDIRNFKIIEDYHISYFSPPCIHFSKIKKCNKIKSTEEDIKNALELVELSFKLGKQSKLCYIIENPFTGLLPKLYPDFKKCDYSEYGFSMKKETAIWSNLPLKLKVQKEIKYNNLTLSALSKQNRSAVPIPLAQYIKRIIIKTFNKELQEFKIPFNGIPGSKRI